MTPNTIIRWVLIIGVPVILLVDWLLGVTFGHEATISAVVQDWSENWRLLWFVGSYTFGLLCGHWFWWPKHTNENQNRNLKG